LNLRAEDVDNYGKCRIFDSDRNEELRRMPNISTLLNAGTRTLSEHDSKQVLAEYGIPVTDEKIIDTESDAVAAATAIGHPVALKASGAALTHKTERDLIALHLRSEEEVRVAYRRLASKAEVNEVLVQQMVTGERELVVGMTRDPHFGPCVMLGLGGIFTEILMDTAFRIAPLGRRDAMHMMDEFRGSRLLDAVRGMLPVDRDALADILVAVGHMAMDHDVIREVDINPLKFIDGKPVAVDALVVLDPTPSRDDQLTVPHEPFGEGFPPRSICVVGVSREGGSSVPGYSGIRIFRLLRDVGFEGRVYPINPKAEEIDGVKAYPNVTSVPEQLDLAIIAVSAPIVPGVLEECLASGARNVHICSSGFAEMGTPEGRALQDRITEIASRGRMRVIGPNCMGFHIPSAKMKMFEEIENFDQGPVAFISQSGGHAQTYLFQAPEFGIGFSKMISYGNALTLDADDFLEYLATDAETQVICAYIEGVKNARRFFEQVYAICPEKPIIILKGGLTDAGARAAASHTGSMAGERTIWETLFKQTGAVSVQSLDEMAEATYCFLRLKPLCRMQAAVIAVGGGATVSSGDICAREGLIVPALTPATIRELSEFIPLVNQGIANPLDIPGIVFNQKAMGRTFEVLNADPEIDVILMNIPARIFSGTRGDILRMFLEMVRDFTRNHADAKPIVVALSEGARLGMTESGVRGLREGGIVAFSSLPKACRALRRFSGYYREMDDRREWEVGRG
jgi:acyl-CoA synthetase (NDP forming)